MHITISCNDTLLAVTATDLVMLACIFQRLLAKPLVTMHVWTTEVLETALSCGMALDGFAAKLLVAPSASIGTLDHEIIQLQADQPRCTEAVRPGKVLSVNGTCGSRRT